MAGRFSFPVAFPDAMIGQRFQSTTPTFLASRSRSLSSCFVTTAALLVAALCGPTTGFGFAGSPLGSQLGRGRRPWPTTIRVSYGGAGGANLLTVIRPKPRGFKPLEQQKIQYLSAVTPMPGKQKKLYYDKSIRGYPLSEVFMRFPGKTNWKLIGELASATGDFREAVRAQWPILVKHTYYMSKKSHFWLATDTPIEFGYADENAEIVSVKDPLPEGVSPLTLKAMLNRCGFKMQEKPSQWLKARTVRKNFIETKKDFIRRKPGMLYRKWLSGYRGCRWFNIMKYKGAYSHWFGGMRRHTFKSNFVAGKEKSPKKLPKSVGINPVQAPYFWG